MYKLLKTLRFILYPLYLFSYFVPRDKNIWLFGAHQNRYAENSKALFIYASKNVKSVTPIWISGDRSLCEALHVKGYKAYLRWSVKGMYYSLKAKYYFYNVYSDDINFYTCANATMINLWHGIPLKHIEFDIKKGPLSRMFNSGFSPIYRFFKPYIFRNPDYVLSTSSYVTSLFSSAFRIAPSQCLEFGYPRCDVLLDTTTTKDVKENRVLFYMPTWRSNNADFLNDAIPNFHLLNEALKKNSITMMIKLHPNSTSEKKEYSHIHFLDEKADVYALLVESDYLMSDYSSIYFDYLLLDKEILFYPFDYDEYTAEDRAFYFEYDEKTPGIKMYSFDALLAQINRLETLDYKTKRKEIRDEFWKYQDMYASKRVCDYFEGLQ